MTRPLLGCIADDFTGATDLANNLVRAGMRTVQTIGLPADDGGAADDALTQADAIVVALKSRTIPADEAVAQSLAALRWLQACGVQQVYFKVCSTFDSTPAGNIGPVTEALMAALDAPFTIATPAFPDNGRTVFKGHLFVGDVLLSDSGMRHHPLTPMTDAHLVRVMQAQCRSRRVGLIDHLCVALGEAAIRARMAELQAQGITIAIVDAVSNDDLLRLAPALRDQKLITAGSGVAIGLPGNFGLTPSPQTTRLPTPRGGRAIVSGSCSVATNGQVADFIRRGGVAHAVDPLALAAGPGSVPAAIAQALDWARPHLAAGAPVLVYATAAPEAVQAIQQQLGVARAGALVEEALAGIARGLVIGGTGAAGVGQLIVAGGETSGACVQALGIRQLAIGAQIAPGVPWCHARPAVAPEGLHLALKSGNFGAVDFFSQAFTLLEETA